jgi:urease gamma subunit
MNLEKRQEAMRFSKAERAARRKALVTERRKAKDAKRAYRHNQGMYLSRKKAKVALIKGEKEAYRESTRLFMSLCSELINVKNRLRGARLAYEEALPSVIKLQLEYARGWRESREALLREQAEMRKSSNGT